MIGQASCSRAVALMRVLGVLALAGAVLTLAGCSGQPKAEPTAAEPAAPAIPLPTYAELAESERARTEGLERLWARVAAQIRFPEVAGGDLREEQVEGHLQIEQPGRVALSVGKLSETLIYLGSDGERSFLIDLLDDRDRVAVVYPAGQLELGSADGVLALDPADLPLLLALGPLPELGLVPGSEPEVRAGGADRPETVVVVIPDARGERRVYFDLNERRPVAVELDRGFAADGVPAVVIAELSSYDAVSVRGRAELRPRSAMRAAIRVPEARVELTLWLTDAQNRPIRAVAFDIDRLAEVYRVDRRLGPEDLSAAVSGP